jgi:hypothetical protein
MELKSTMGWGVAVGWGVGGGGNATGVGVDGKLNGVGVGWGVAVGAGVAVGRRVGNGAAVGAAARTSRTRWSMRWSISDEEGPQAASVRPSSPKITIARLVVIRMTNVHYESPNPFG